MDLAQYKVSHPGGPGVVQPLSRRLLCCRRHRRYSTNGSDGDGVKVVVGIGRCRYQSNIVRIDVNRCDKRRAFQIINLFYIKSQFYISITKNLTQTS